MKIFRRKVKSGTGHGRKIGFPTINLNIGRFGEHFSHGIYSCTVQINSKSYKGGLHFGPTLSSKKPTLEIFIVGFSGNLYNKTISFSPLKRLRDVIHFESFDELKKQIKKDVEPLT